MPSRQTFRVKIKENEKIDNYFDPAREIKKLWNMKVGVISIIIGAFGTVSKDLGLVRGLEELEKGGCAEL